MLEQTGFKFEPIESVVRSCINWAIKRACSSLLYTCMVKHHYYPSIHKVWKVCYDLTVLNYRYTKLFQKKIQIQDRDKFHYPFLKQFLSISFLLLNTSKNQKLLVVRLLERCHNNSTFTLRLLQRLEGNLMMLRKSQELKNLLFAPKNVNIKNFLQSTSDLRESKQQSSNNLAIRSITDVFNQCSNAKLSELSSQSWLLLYSIYEVI